MSEIQVNSIKSLSGPLINLQSDILATGKNLDVNKIYLQSYSTSAYSGDGNSQKLVTSKYYVDDQLNQLRAVVSAIGGSAGAGLSGIAALSAGLSAEGAAIRAESDNKYLFRSKFDIHSGGGLTFSGGPYKFTSGSPVVFSGSSVGVGAWFSSAANTPLSTLHVSAADARITIQDTTFGTTASFQIMAQTGNTTKLFRIYDVGASPAVDLLCIKPDGNVGIGNVQSPLAKLHVKSGGGEGLRLETTVARGSGQNYLAFNDPTGMKGYVGCGSNSNDSIALINSLSAPLYLGTSGITRMIISANGNVGIGTGESSPNSKLEISGTNASPHLVLRSTTGNTLPEIRFMENNSSSWAFGGNGANATFYIRDDFQSGTPVRLAITNTGNVGIGTATPSAKLQTIDTYNAARFGNNAVNALTIGSHGGGPYCGIGYNINFNSGGDNLYFAVGNDRTSLIRFTDGGFEFKGNSVVGAVSGTPFALTNYMTILNTGNIVVIVGNVSADKAPTLGEHLCNKTYVDDKLRIGSVFSFILPSGGYATTDVTTAMNAGYVMPPGWTVTSPYANGAPITWTVPANSGAWVGWWTAMNNTNTHGNISWANSGSIQTVTVPAPYNNLPFFMTVRRVS